MSELDEIRQDHQPHKNLHTVSGDDVCVTCGVRLPCPTLRVLDALATEQAAHAETRAKLDTATTVSGRAHRAVEQIEAHRATTAAALTQALAERDGLREALEECVATAADCRANLTPIGGYKDLLPYPTYRRVWDASYNAEQKAFAALDAALATAPNTKDGDAHANDPKPGRT